MGMCLLYFVAPPGGGGLEGKLNFSHIDRIKIALYCILEDIRCMMALYWVSIFL